MANLIVGSVVNGEYTKTNASTEATKSSNSTSTSKTAAQENGGYTEEMFLQLLVAEMQYQDPLEPTDNGEYVSQLASFSQIEAVQAVQENMQTIQANSIVGKYAALTVNGTEVSGRVDFVTKDDDGNLKVSINNELYDMDEIESVVDGDFYAAKYVSNLFMDAIDKLPTKETVTILDGDEIGEAISYYNNMDAYALSFVDADRINKYLAVVEQYNKLINSKEAADNNSEAASDTGNTDTQAEETEAIDTTEGEEI